MAFCSLSSSTTIASIPRLVANLTSSIACRFVGSATARNSRLPRRKSGSTRCLASSLSLTRRTESRSMFTASRSNSGTPNSLEAATAMSRALAAPLAISCVTTFVLRSRAALTASSIAASSTTPSCTRRCGRPPKPARAAPSAAEAFSFMGLWRAKRAGRSVYPRGGGAQLSNTSPILKDRATALAGCASHLAKGDPHRQKKPRHEAGA